MSLSGLKIPVSLIGRLYKEVVVEPSAKQVLPVTEFGQQEPAVQPGEPLKTVENTVPPAVTLVTPSTSETLVYLGNNQQKIAILVHYPNDKHIADAPLDLLSKMLAACQLNLAGVAIINTATQKVTYQLLQEQLQAGKVILFGINATAIALPMQFPLYKDQVFANTIYLQSDALDSMLPDTNDSKTLKTALWGAFKRIFNL
jgi:hypothetical protein